MDNIVTTATSQVTGNDVHAARLGTRFGRLDLLSQIALLAVEELGIDFESLPAGRPTPNPSQEGNLKSHTSQSSPPLEGPGVGLGKKIAKLRLPSLTRDRVGICLAAGTGSLSTDVDYWNGRDAAGGPSPTLFAYTLPSAAIGEIAIRHRLTGPNLCFVGDDAAALSEAHAWLRAGTVDACLCISSNVVTEAAAKLIGVPPAAMARASFLQRKNSP